MLKSISFKKLAVLTAGLAIVLSSCGLQNQAGDSSGSGKTKNFALLADGQFCYDSPVEQQQAAQAFEDVHIAWHDNEFDADNNGVVEWADHDVVVEPLFMAFDAQVGGCPAPAPTASGGDEAAAEAALYTCVKPEKKQEMIDGYKEQIAKTEYPADWSTAAIADYQDRMKRGLATAELICTN
jgi:hypothetical protein